MRCNPRLGRPMCWVGVVLAVLAGGLLRADDDVVKEFQKKYASTDPAQRKEAVGLLKGSQDKKVLQALKTVASLDKDAGVRGEAFKLITEGKDLDASLAILAATIFSGEKDKAVKLEMASYMGSLEFKWPVLNALCEYGKSLRYPNLPHFDRTNGRGETPAEKKMTEAAKETRDEVDQFLKVLSKVSGASFTASSNSPHEVRDWWRANSLKVQQQDMELKKKKDGEAKEAAKEGAKKN